jgi:hypothetical protein
MTFLREPLRVQCRAVRTCTPHAGQSRSELVDLSLLAGLIEGGQVVLTVSGDAGAAGRVAG